MTEIKSFGNRGPDKKTHDNLVHITFKRKYAYIERESKGRLWLVVGKVSIAEARKVTTFEEADRLYDRSTDEGE